MEMFNKVFSQVSNSVRDSVSSTVSQISGVLPGNPLTREFESSVHIASAGNGLLWRIYRGSKRSTKQEASIFVFEKRQLEKYNKTDKDLILETLRRGVVQLTKIRHPKILTVQHPLEESRDSLAFATEPIFASLANVLGQTTNMPQPANMSDYKLYDIEIKYGLLQIAEGLAFLHNDMKLLHKNITPESIIINSQGAWKVFGLDFCIHNTSPPNSAPFFPFEEYSPTLPSVCHPNLDYLAPECIMSQTHSPASDMFSLGMLIYTLNSPEKNCIRPVKDIQAFKNRVQELKKIGVGKLQCIPEGLQEFAKLLLNVTPEIRPDAHQFIKIPYFDDVGIKTLTYLDSLLQWDNLQKSQFYKGLPEALNKLPQRVKVQRVLACLVHDLGQPTMVPFILPSLFDIAQGCTQSEFCTYLLPHIKPLMKLMEPIQILLIMLQRMELLLKLTPAEDIQQHVLPMLNRGLDSDSPQVHELCLSVLPTFAGLLDHANVKNSLLPRIKKLCLNTATLSVRVNCLLCIGKLLEHLDKWLVLDEVLPFLPQIPSREPAVLMGILGIYKISLNHKKLGITKEIIATRVLPFLIPLCIENGLTILQFNALTTLVKDMFQIVETEHRTKLEQLNSVKDEQKILLNTMPTVISKSKSVELSSEFSGLGLDNFVTGMSLQEKQNVAKQQDTVEMFGNQSIIEPLKISNTPNSKDLSSLLIDGWTSSTVTTPNNNSNLVMSNNHWSNKSNNIQHTSSVSNYNPVLNANQNYINKNQNMNNSNFNFTLSTTSPMNSNFPCSTAANLGAANLTFNQNFCSHKPNFPPPNSSFGTPNPWSSNKLSSNFNKSDSAQNWSALDNLLPAGSSSNINKVPMNLLAVQKTPLIANNINNDKNKTGLSNEDIMDLLS